MGVDTVSEMEQWSGVASRCWGKVFHDGQTLKIEAPFLASPVGSSAPRKNTLYRRRSGPAGAIEVVITEERQDLPFSTPMMDDRSV